MADSIEFWRAGKWTMVYLNGELVTHSVYVVDQTAQMWKSTAEEKRRWAYTAVSRASVSVTVAAVRP